MESAKPTKTWHADDPAPSAIEVFQSTLDGLAGDDVEVYLEETESEDGSWPYVDQIHTRTYTIHTLTAHAVAEWESGQCDGTMETWSSLTVTLYGTDPMLLDTFDDFFHRHFGA